MAKSSKLKTIIFTVALLLLTINIYSMDKKSYPDFLLKLINVYGHSFVVIDNNKIKWDDGEISILDDGLVKSPKEMIDNADIEDQFSMVYTKGDLLSPPKNEYNDPGRVRNNIFFKKLYGGSPEEVKQNLKKLKWMPKYTDIELLFNTKHGAWDSLKAVSNQLEKLDEEFLKYVTVTAGTYNWRVIKDTERLSAHSFGIAIDINVEYSSYWKWDKTYRYRNRIPMEIIKIFEDNGFIWGGKWYHYDTMHFEYRPELL